MSVDWYRNMTWDEAIERTFFEKLRRARSKPQYLRIQACTLAHSHPEVALKLLERYFEFDDTFDHAQAHVDQATALLALDRVDEALAEYEAALDRESVFPNVLTNAYLELPYVVATRGIRSLYRRAIEILHLFESRLTFPIDHFRWQAAYALIAADISELQTARIHAERALEAARLNFSGFRYHPTVGLVTSEEDDIVIKLKAIFAE